MTASGSYLIPSFQRARVGDAMRAGVISCPPDSSMRDVARIMTTNHVHAVVVRGVADGGAWGVVTDRDLLRVATRAEDQNAGACASEVLVTVAPHEPLEVACAMAAALIVPESEPARFSSAAA